MALLKEIIGRLQAYVLHSSQCHIIDYMQRIEKQCYTEVKKENFESEIHWKFALCCGWINFFRTVFKMFLWIGPNCYLIYMLDCRDTVSLTTGSRACLYHSYHLFSENNLSYCSNSEQRKRDARSGCSQAVRQTRQTFLVFVLISVISEMNVLSWHNTFHWKTVRASQTA